MRTTTRAMVMAALVALTILASTRIARAQDHLLVKVPFDFVAGNTTLPAGEYAITSSGPTRPLILISRTDSAASAYLGSNAIVSADIQSESKLVFNRYGDRYFLSQIWSEGNASGRMLMKSAREKEVALSTKLEDQSQVTLVAGLPRNNP